MATGAFPRILQAVAFWASAAPVQRALTFLDAAGQGMHVATNWMR